MNSQKIVSCFHHSFAGGSKNTSRLLHFLSQNGYSVDAYFFEAPQYFAYTKSPVKTHIMDISGIHSEVIDSSVIKTYSVSNKIIEDFKGKADSILFGANLFPYCNILLDVKSQMKHFQNCDPKLILHPVGSDIWQIGTQIKSRVKWLLDNPLVDSVVTYSESFITDIKEYYNIEKDIHVLPPVLENEKFFPLSKIENLARRKSLNFNEDDFIIHHHSSMRKIKCPETVLDIALKSAQLISRKCFLIMTGPVPYAEVASLNLALTSIKDNSVFIYKTEKENLTIYWTGLLSNVEYLLQASDVELNTSIYDSFNLALMEAMACGIPVITSDVVGISNHIIRAEGGYCFPTKKLKYDELNELLKSGNSKKSLFDIDYAVDAMLSIARDKPSAKKMGQNGARYTSEEFSFAKAAKEFYNLIN
ncbi:MAG: N-acetyl-alpha-D-glucosaminyl L-malate synthase BshA [Ferruginibacter sp.]|nr:N-acetyl-alpha-D-glucosaminyl L-malate synthase BshA [Ferruginibacter sp.]